MRCVIVFTINEDILVYTLLNAHQNTTRCVEGISSSTWVHYMTEDVYKGYKYYSGGMLIYMLEQILASASSLKHLLCFFLFNLSDYCTVDCAGIVPYKVTKNWCTKKRRECRLLSGQAL